MDHSEARGGRTKVEGCGGSGEGGTRPELSKHLRKSLWLMYMGKMCGTNLLRKI